MKHLLNLADKYGGWLDRRNIRLTFLKNIVKLFLSVIKTKLNIG